MNKPHSESSVSMSIITASKDRFQVTVQELFVKYLCRKFKYALYLSIIISISVPISLQFAFHLAFVLGLPHHDGLFSLLLFSFSFQTSLD